MTSNVDFISRGLELIKKKSDVYPVPDKIIEKKTFLNHLVQKVVEEKKKDRKKVSFFVDIHCLGNREKDCARLFCFVVFFFSTKVDR